MNIGDIQAVEKWIASNSDKTFDITIGGQLFGGKEGEAPQQPKSCKVLGDTLILYFSTTERLWIKKPNKITVSGLGLHIEAAETVRWGWHYYGRPQTDLNWCELIYLVDGKNITYFAVGPLDTHYSETGKIEFQGESLIVID